MLLDACAQISNHLDYSVKSSSQDDHFIAAQLDLAKISEYLHVPPPTTVADAPRLPKADGPVM
ncbi:hypothetical protein ACFH04_05565 [Streptomyces noboritoensis]|uniref:Uncharacterized protein n=1 Tax=Streptomyces noboritoensis TaxID=67337 RepID=A0ABV6TBP2_9ACTN